MKRRMAITSLYCSQIIQWMGNQALLKLFWMESVWWARPDSHANGSEYAIFLSI